MGNPETSLLSSVSVWDPGFLLSPPPPWEDPPFTLILLCFHTKMETLVQLKNNPFLMGLCRNCPPPDLQYDNSSGKFCVLCIKLCFCASVITIPISFITRTLSHLYLCAISDLGGDWAEPGPGRLVLHGGGRPCAVLQVQRDGRGLAGWRLSHRKTQAAVAILLVHPEPPVHVEPPLLLTLRLFPTSHCSIYSSKIARSFFFYHLIFIFYLVICFYL